jgi:leucyl aminopeptidase
MDISDVADRRPDVKTAIRAANVAKVTFPLAMSKQTSVNALLGRLSMDTMKTNLEYFSTKFPTRYFNSTSGAQSSEWLFQQVSAVIKEAKAEGVATVRQFRHDRGPRPWKQSSTIATIKGKSNVIVAIGAHQDSINMLFPSMAPAPGADDDGSGTMTILEAMRVLLQDPDILAGNAPNTLEFQWYAAEEGGLLGSRAVFQQYRRENRDVRAMLQQDMTGYIAKTIAAGKPEALGVITDFVDPALTEFIQKIIAAYCDIPAVLTQCGYACSDHASARDAGYPSAFVIEGEMRLTNDKIHTADDTMEYISLPHMLQHAKLTLGLAYELAYATLPKSF